MGVESCRASPAPPVGRPVYGTPYLGHGLRRPNFVPKFGASVKSSCPTADSSCCGAQNSLLADCSQNFDRCHSFLLASSATGGARKRPPLHKGAFRTGGCGLPRRFAPRNDSPKPLSFRGGPTGRRGNPSFFTMDGGSGRRTKDEGNGTPRSSAPTERRESPINHPSQPARSEASAPAWARDGRESTQGSSQKGDRRRDCPGSA